MQIIGEAFAGHYKAKRQDGEFGFEIETEVLSDMDYPDGFLKAQGGDEDKPVMTFTTPKMPKWKAVTDNSLRNYGIEYIFKRPYIYKTALDAIEEFGTATTEAKIPFIKNAPGTSVHVHVNMYNETFLTLGNFVTLYILFENILQEFAGPQRRTNLFALPTRVSEPVTWNLIEMFEQMQEGNIHCIRWEEDNVKYGALNIASMTRLGSLEIRSMRGVTDTKTLKEWLGIINAILVFARTEGVTPRTIIREYRVKGVDFFDEVFDEFRFPLLKVCEIPLQILIDRNLYYAGLIAKTVRDWNTLGDNFTANVKVDRKKKEHIFGEIQLDNPVLVNAGNNPLDNNPFPHNWEAMLVNPAPLPAQANQWFEPEPDGDF